MSMDFSRVISGDSHVREPADLWWQVLGKKYGDRVPRPITEHAGIKGKFFSVGRHASKYGVGEKPEAERTEEEDLLVRSGFDPGVRVEFQRKAGVTAELIFPSLAAQIIAMDDAEVAQQSCRVYNDWIAEFTQHDPKRLLMVAVTPMHDVAWAMAELDRLAKKNRIRAVLINVAPPKGAPPYRDPAYDPFWAKCQEMGLPVVLHIITGQVIDPLLYFHTPEQYAEAPRAMLQVWSEMGEILANDFIFGKVLDRFPRLKILCGEYEISWIPHYMFRLDQLQSALSSYVKLASLEMKPSEYLRQRVWHGMVDDPLAAEVMQHVGTSQVLWGSDFPHVRSIGLDTQERLPELLAGLSPEDQRNIVGGNATHLLNL